MINQINLIALLATISVLFVAGTSKADETKRTAHSYVISGDQFSKSSDTVSSKSLNWISGSPVLLPSLPELETISDQVALCYFWPLYCSPGDPNDKKLVAQLSEPKLVQVSWLCLTWPICGWPFEANSGASIRYVAFNEYLQLKKDKAYWNEYSFALTRTAPVVAKPVGFQGIEYKQEMKKAVEYDGRLRAIGNVSSCFYSEVNCRINAERFNHEKDGNHAVPVPVTVPFQGAR